MGLLTQYIINEDKLRGIENLSKMRECGQTRAWWGAFTNVNQCRGFPNQLTSLTIWIFMPRRMPSSRNSFFFNVLGQCQYVGFSKEQSRESDFFQKYAATVTYTMVIVTARTIHTLHPRAMFIENGPERRCEIYPDLFYSTILWSEHGLYFVREPGDSFTICFEDVCSKIEWGRTRILMSIRVVTCDENAHFSFNFL